MRRTWFLITVLLGMTVAVGTVSTPEADAQTSAREHVRVVFVIDNSGSMSEIGGSDPSQERVNGVRSLIGVLRSFQKSAQEQRDLQFGAVSFGDDVSVLSPLADVSNPDLEGRIRAENLGGTDLAAALCAGWAMVANRVPSTRSGCSTGSDVVERTGLSSTPAPAEASRIVVLVTDGSPAPKNQLPLVLNGEPSARDCPETAGTETSDGDLYLCALGPLWSALNREARTTLVVVGLDTNDTWFSKSEPYWKRVVSCVDTGCEGAIYRSTTAADLPSWILTASRIVKLCPNESGVSKCEIGADLASANFFVTGVGGGVSRICPPAGSSHCEESTARSKSLVSADQGSHMWRVENPQQGRWEVYGPPSARVLVDTLKRPPPPPPPRPSLQLKLITPAQAKVGDEYSGRADAHGGHPDYRFTIPRGELAPGVRLNASTGEFHGTPSKPGTFAYTVRVVDSNGAAEEVTGQMSVERLTPPPVADWMLVALAGLFVLILFGLLSAVAVRAEHEMPGNAPNHVGRRARTIDLGVTDSQGNRQDFVRRGVVASRQLTEGVDAARWIGLQWIVAGAPVVRRWNTASVSQFVRDTVRGRSLHELGPRLRRRPRNG